jgi:hypothetical protein
MRHMRPSLAVVSRTARLRIARLRPLRESGGTMSRDPLASAAFDGAKQSNGGGGLELTVTLSVDQLAALEERITASVLERVLSAAPDRLLTVDELAEMLATTPEWVRRHQAELGGYRLSDGGGRNPIRFRLADVERFLASRRLRPPVRAAAGGWRQDPSWALG